MRITLPSGTDAELARPSGPPSRGLVLLPDIGGLRPLFDDLLADLAETRGWAVCAPEPWPGRTSMTLEERLESVDSLLDDDVLGDAVAAADVLETDTVAVLGFCMGGMFAMKAAGTGRFDRAVAFYGMIRVPERWANPANAHPIDVVAADGACPVLGIFGGADAWTPPDDVDALEAAGATVRRYPDADHGFVHDPSRPAHRAEDAADAWSAVFDFLS